MAEQQARWAPQKKDTLEALADEILHNYGRGRAIVAIDGRHDSGMFEFADALAAVLRTRGRTVFRASIEDFHQSRARRESGLYENGYDYSLLRRVLIDPYRTAGSTGFAVTGFDAQRDEPVFQPKWKSAGLDAILLVDGVFLNRPELSGLWNYSLWLESKPELENKPEFEGEAELQDGEDAAYIAAVNPSAKATASYNNADPEHPRRVFADSC